MRVTRVGVVTQRLALHAVVVSCGGRGTQLNRSQALAPSLALSLTLSLTLTPTVT